MLVKTFLLLISLFSSTFGSSIRGAPSNSSLPEGATTRIVGGMPTKGNIYPYFATVDEGATNLCGGTLIHPSFVLTAAHCRNAYTSGGSVRVGVWSHFWSQKGSIEKRRIQQFIPHPNYQGRLVRNDLMLIQLESPIYDVPLIGFREAADLDVKDDGQWLTVIGFGTMEEGNDKHISSKLMQVDLQTYKTSWCKKRYPGELEPRTMMCAGGHVKDRDSCLGDSGGPLIYNGAQPIQVGIVSWGFGCGRKGAPGVYTRVGMYTDWIEETICSSLDQREAQKTEYCKVTPRPTPYPTPRPTPWPTPYPTPRPTPRPTLFPTAHPTPKPSFKPSLKPTPRPSTRSVAEPMKKKKENDILAHFRLEYHSQGSGVTWKLQDDTTDELISEGPRSDSLQGIGSLELTLTLTAGHSYSLTVSQSKGFNGKYLLTTNTGTLVQGSSSKNSKSATTKTTRFSLPFPIITSCNANDNEGSRPIVLDRGIRGYCHWLVLSSYKYLCHYADIALTCPRTCQLCGSDNNNKWECNKDQKSTQKVNMGDVLGEKSCEWLSSSLTGGTSRFVDVCQRTNVALQCAKTCSTCKEYPSRY